MYQEYCGRYGKKRAVTAIADEYGCVQGTVYRHLDAAGIRPTRKMPERPSADRLRADSDAIATAHGTARAVAPTLARELGVTQTTIRKWLAEYGIRPRVALTAPSRPILDACPCGTEAVARYKGRDPALCFRCYMRTRSAEEAATGTLTRVSRDHATNAKTGKPCTDCGGYYPPCVLHWDHVPGRGPKLFNLGRADYSLEKVLAEIAKCDLVCANCHAIRTWNRKHPEAPVSLLGPVPGDDDAVTAEGLLF